MARVGAKVGGHTVDGQTILLINPSARKNAALRPPRVRRKSVGLRARRTYTVATPA
ncbi:MAG TPA: hypothetical protein VF447_07645 [Terriglobales bacterium]